MAGMLTAAVFEITWDANPPRENVTQYKVYHNNEFHSATNDTEAVITGEVGDAVYVTAVNQLGVESFPSDSLQLSQPQYIPPLRLVIEVSTDLKNWHPVYIDPEKTFIKAKLSHAENETSSQK